MVDRANGRPAGVKGAPDDETEPAERRRVEFSGDRTGSGELAWGQRTLWRLMQQSDSWLPIGTRLPLPPGTSVDDAVADLRFVMDSYPSIRTRLRLGQGDPAQVVHAHGEVELEVVDAPDDADPAAVAKQVQQRFWSSSHDFAADWPVRMAVVRHRGQLTHRVWVMCHLVTDGTGARTMLAELASRDTSRSASARSALEQAAWQATPAGQRQSQAALRHWENLLASLPTRRLPAPTERPGPRYWQGLFNSPATYLAGRLISDRTGIEAATVLLGLYAISLARVTGSSPVAFQVTVSNRFRPGLAGSVAPVMQNGLCAIEIADQPVDRLLADCRRRAMSAYKHAYYDPDQLSDLMDRVAAQRGEPVETAFFFNDRRLKPRPPAGPAPTPEEVTAARAQTSFSWTHQGDHHPFDPLFVNVDDLPDTLQLTVLNDTHRLAPADVESVVRGMEEIAVAAALDPATRAGVDPGAVRP